MQKFINESELFLVENLLAGIGYKKVRSEYANGVDTYEAKWEQGIRAVSISQSEPNQFFIITY